MTQKPMMQAAERNTSHSGSITWGIVEDLKRGLRRARRRLSKKIIETELVDKTPKVHHR